MSDLCHQAPRWHASRHRSLPPVSTCTVAVSSIHTAQLRHNVSYAMVTASHNVLMAIFTGEPELADFIGAKDEGSTDDNWSYKTCKSPVKVTINKPTPSFSTTSEYLYRQHHIHCVSTSKCMICNIHNVCNDHFFCLQARCPSCRQTNSVRALKGNVHCHKH